MKVLIEIHRYQLFWRRLIEDSYHAKETSENTKLKENPKDDNYVQKRIRTIVKKKITMLLLRAPWLKESFLIKARHDDDISTPRQAKSFTLFVGMVTKPKNTHGTQRDIYYLVRLCRTVGRRNGRFRILLMKPMATDSRDRVMASP